MLPPFIIEQIRRREERERRPYEQQPQLELPVAPPRPQQPKRHDDNDDVQRGVIILEL